MIDTISFNAESLNDSIAKVIPIIQAIRENSAPAPFTYVNIVISLFAAVFGLGSFYYAKKTADNVSRLSKDTQILLCEDLIRDILAQIVRLLVAWRRQSKKEVVSEKFLKELRYWPSDIYFKQEVYNSKSKIYKKIYDLRLRMQDYNIGIETFKKTLQKKKNVEKEIEELYRSNWKNLYKAYDIYQLICNRKELISNREGALRDLYTILHDDYRKTLKTKDAYKNVSDETNLKDEFLFFYEKDIKETIIEDPIRKIKEILKEPICEDASIFEQCLRITDNMK